MEYKESLSESEAVLLHIVGEFRNADPKVVLKNIGLAGAEKIFCDVINDSFDKNKFSKVTEAINHAFIGLYSHKVNEFQDEMLSYKYRVKALEEKYEPSPDDTITNYAHFGFTFILGVIIGVVAGIVICGVASQ